MMCISVRARKIVFASALPVLVLSLCVFQPLSARAATSSDDSQGLVAPSSPERSGYALTASEEFNGNDINHQLFMSDYLPHWSTSEGTRARYQVSGGSLKLMIDQDQKPWDPAFDGDTKVSSIQTYNRDYIHRWTNYPDVARHTEPFRGHIQKYGYFEVRAKAASGGGIHSAWWMTGVNQDQPENANKQARQSGEVDIFEILGRNGTTEALMSTHTWGDYFHTWPTRASFGDGSDLSAQWHTYGFEWLPGKMRLYLDGKLVVTRNQSPDYPMVTYLGVYEKSGDSWTGPFDPRVPYPKTFEIDYFRAYQKKPELPYSQNISDGVLRGQSVADSGTVRWMGGKGNDVTVREVYAPEAGVYRMAFDYRSEDPRNVSLQVNGGQTHTFEKLSTGSASGAFQSQPFAAQLRQGWNRIRFFNDSGYAPDLGVLQVREIVPVNGALRIPLTDAVLGGGVIADRGVVRWVGGNADRTVAVPDVYVHDDGQYTLTIEYASAEDRRLQLIVDGARPFTLDNMNSGDWSRRATRTISVPLTRGVHMVTLGNDSAPAPDLISLTVTKVTS